jgi:hypothetical protein
VETSQNLFIILRGLALTPHSSGLTFLGSAVTPAGLGDSSFGDQGPGSSQILFLDSNVFASALFPATLSQTLFTLSDGTSFQADSNVLTAMLLPSNGTALEAGVDSVVLTGCRDRLC